MGKIYHYTKLNTALDYILPSMKLRTNSLSNMNDPKENQPWAFGGINIDYKKLYPETYTESTHIEHQFKLGYEIKSSVQILCFVKDTDSKGFLNNLMWTHYAQNHSGVCLELDSEKFINENEITDFQFDNVKYNLNNFLLDFRDIEINKIYLKNIFDKYYTQLFYLKTSNWRKEREKRLVVFSKEQLYLKIKKSLTGIYLGICMPYQYRPTIDNLIVPEKTKIYDMIWDNNCLKASEREYGDFRPDIMRKFIKY